MSKSLPNILQRINWMVGAGIVFRVLSAVTTLSMTYFLEPEVYAEYSFAMSLALLTALVAAAGLPDYIVSRAENGRLQTATLVWQSWLLNFLLGSICLLVIFLISNQESISTAGKWGIMFINCATILAGGNIISQAALRSIHRVSTQAKLMLLSISLSMITLVSTAWIWGDVRLIGIATLAVFTVMFGVHLIVLRRYQLVQRISVSLNTFTQLFQKTFPFGIVLMLEMAIPVFASYLVLTRFSSALAGSFNLMITLLLSAMMIATVLDQTFYPVLVSSTHAAKSRVLAGYWLFSLLIVVPAFLTFFFHAEAIATIPIFQKYMRLTSYVTLLAYMVPLHFMSKVCAVYFRLRNLQRVPIVLYMGGLIWMAIRSSGAEVSPVHVGHFIIEVQAVLLLFLSVPLLRFIADRAFVQQVWQFMLPGVIACLVMVFFVNNLLVLMIVLLGYFIMAWWLQLHKILLSLTKINL